jgi:hypothetical protein
MKQNMIKSNIFCLLLFFGLSHKVALSQDKCKEEIKSYYDKTKELALSTYSSGKTIYFDYSITMAPKRKEDKAQRYDIALWMNDRKMKMVNNHISIYKDEHESFMVLPDSKMIVRSDAVPTNKDYMKKNSVWNMLQDTMLLMSDAKECEQFKSKSGESMKKIVLMLNKKGVELFHISSITFNISEDKKEIKMIRIDYPPDRPKINGGVEFSFMEIDINASSAVDDVNKVFPQNMEAVFFSPGHKLTSTYTGYKVIDKRRLAKK